MDLLTVRSRDCHHCSITRGELESKGGYRHRDEFFCPQKGLSSFTSYIQLLTEMKFSRCGNQCIIESIWKNKALSGKNAGGLLFHFKTGEDETTQKLPSVTQWINGRAGGKRCVFGFQSGILSTPSPAPLSRTQLCSVLWPSCTLAQLTFKYCQMAGKEVVNTSSLVSLLEK